MKKITPFIISLLIIVSIVFLTQTGCRNKKEIPVSVKDTTITPVNAITSLLLDSAYVEDFITQRNLEDSSAQRLRNFYVSRNFQYAWFTEDGIAEQAKAFWNLRNHYVKFNRDSSLYDKVLDEKMKVLTTDSTFISQGDKRMIELHLTQNFFEYARYAYAGKIDPEELQWHIPRKKLDPVALLDSIIKNKGNSEVNWEPVNEQYTRMKNQLAKFADMENAGWKPLDEKKRLAKGSSDSSVADLKFRLFLAGDLTINDSSFVFDSILVTAVKNAQKRFGLKQTGIADAAIIKQLNVPPSERIQQLLINMERMRWLPKEQAGIRLVANIPEFILHVYNNDTVVFDMNIVVGKAGTSSVIFTDELKYIVFSPYWNVPTSITKNEIMPGMRRNSNYLNSKNMEITGYNGSTPVVRQKPGGSNALGNVKFIFPNSYNIYFHDTPSKSLFSKETRAFSHGCIRLQEPFKLAQFLLRNDTSWNDEKIKAAMNLGEEKWVTLPKSVPVFITYFTAWVDENGNVHFRDDIYGHDLELKKRLFK